MAAGLGVNARDYRSKCLRPMLLLLGGLPLLGHLLLRRLLGHLTLGCLLLRRLLGHLTLGHLLLRRLPGPPYVLGAFFFVDFFEAFRATFLPVTFLAAFFFFAILMAPVQGTVVIPDQTLGTLQGRSPVFIKPQATEQRSVVTCGFNRTNHEDVTIRMLAAKQSSARNRYRPPLLACQSFPIETTFLIFRQDEFDKLCEIETILCACKGHDDPDACC